MTRMSEIPAELLVEMTPAVRVFVESLLVQMADMRAEIEDLKTQVKRLTPQNSSLPPSTQHPHARPTPKPKTKSKKKRGGQKGHRRAIRELVPVERCAEVIALRPENCRRCGEGLVGSDPEPIRHQVWDHAGDRTDHRHPNISGIDGPAVAARDDDLLPHCLQVVPTGQFGARLLAFTGLLMGHFRQSKRRAALCLSDLLNMPCCPAATVKMQNRVAEALEKPYEDFEGTTRKRTSTVHGRISNGKAGESESLAVGPQWPPPTLYLRSSPAMRPQRAAYQKLLGDQFCGIISCDRAENVLAKPNDCNGAGRTSSETFNR